MTRNILVAVAWPYGSADIHVGNIAGSYLPADIFARYHRLAGNRVAMVSGTDSHGTPIMVRAEADQVSPLEVYERFHASFLELFQKFGLHYDLYTSTHTDNHFKVSQLIFESLRRNDYIYTERSEQWYAPSHNRFLPDRYVEGTCYICGFEHARGDQCENCGNLLDATQLIEPRSKIDGTRPELRETEHFYLDLAKLQPALVEFLETRQDYWRPNVIRQSLGQIRSDGLRGRAITRDLDWGIPVPVDGWDGKCLYVWFEAVIGYLSATIEWSALRGEPDAWHDWWFNPEAQTFYFIGKDNIPFHAVIWPAELHGVGEWFAKLFEDHAGRLLNLPYDIPANEFLNLEGQKISGSRNWAVYGLDALERYDPDPLRFYLTWTMPETKDTDWDWEAFVRRNNDELVATWGNLANRVLSFAYRHWEGQVPVPEMLSAEDQALLDEIESGFGEVGALIEKVRLRAALAETLRLAAQVNKYLDRTSPWFEIKSDKARAGTIIYTALKAIDSLKILFAPFIPFSSERLNSYLGYEKPLFGVQSVEPVADSLGQHSVLRYHHNDAAGHWGPSALQGGQALQKPKPLFKKIEPSQAEVERARLG